MQSLLDDGPCHGLGLISRIQKKSNGLINLKHGSVYPALKSMVADGLAATVIGESVAGKGGRPRRYYGLTMKGEHVAFIQRKMLRAFLQ